jgi:ribosome-binding protein aMBF1 (putative translation factor)
MASLSRYRPSKAGARTDGSQLARGGTRPCRSVGRPRGGNHQKDRRRRPDAIVGPHVPIGDRLRAARHRVRLTVHALADKSGTGYMTLLRAERGGSLPRAGTLRRLSEVLGVSSDWLLTGMETTSNDEGRA